MKQKDGMKHTNMAAKDRIIAATLSLIMENKDVSQIPISSIAERAGVGLGLINYHFQTKENLINRCVQQVIGQLFGSVDENSARLAQLTPIDKLKSLIKFIATFMTANPELARVSTLTDLSSGSEKDPSDNIMRAYYPIIKDAFAATKNEQELKVILHAIISTVQVTFLRSTVNKKVSGFDFFDEAQRNEFIDTLVDLFCN